MSAIRIVVFIAILSLGMAVPTAELEGQANQARIADQLLSVDRRSQIQALDRLQAIPPEDVEEILASALSEALERRNRAFQRHLERENGWDHADTEFHIGLIESAIRLQPPDVIPLLVGALGTGVKVPRRLADLGEVAAPAVLASIESVETSGRQISSALLTLRFMIEDPGKSPLSSDTRHAVREVARTYLEDPGVWMPDLVLQRAIDLAVSLDDPDLTGTVESLASRPEAVAARMPQVEDAERREHVQAHAAARLAGVPALPSRR